MLVVVTGSAGYLGSEVCRALLDAGHAVRSLDTRPPPVPRGAAVPYEHLDVELRPDVVQLRPLLDGAGAVLHLAALSSDAACEGQHDLVSRLNVELPSQLGRAALLAGVPRVVLASTSAVYGSGEHADEDAPLRPRTVYATSKALAEERLLALVEEGLDPVVLRLGTLFGVSRAMRHDLVVNRMVRSALTQGEVVVHGAGAQRRPLVDVQDAAQAFVWAAARKRLEAVYNVAGPEANVRVRDIAAQVLQQCPGAVLRTEPAPQDGDGYGVATRRLAGAWGQHRWTSLAHGVRALLEAAEPAQAPVPEQRSAPLVVALAVPSITRQDEDAVVRVLRSGWLTRGPVVPRFEAALAEATGARHVVAVSSCTAALHLALLAAGVGPGDEVITTPITWPATANVVEQVGAVPVFADVDPRTLNLDPASVAARVTRRTRAVLPVHMAGAPVDLDALQGGADDRGAVLIEDAAHALGASYAGDPIGSRSRFTCFSFYPTKTITTIEGGALALSEQADADRVRVLANHGMSTSAWSAQQARGTRYDLPQCVAAGFKYNLPDVGAALGLEQLRRMPAFVDRREALVLRYRAALRDLPTVALTTLPSSAGTRSSHHLMPLLLQPPPGRAAERDEVVHRLRAVGVQAGVHYLGLHVQPHHRRRYGARTGELPGASLVSARVLSLPLHCGMSDDDVDHVVGALRGVLDEVYAGTSPHSSAVS